MLVFWCVFWIVIGAWTGYQIFQLTGLTDSTVQSGKALQTAGRALSNLRDVPLIGDSTSQLGGQVRTTADGIVANGTQARQSVQRLGVLIGVAVALGPTGPVVLFYLPMRLARRREVNAVKRALNAGSAGPALEAHLAEQAVAHLTFERLWALTQDPRGDLARGHHRALADAELARLGLQRVEAGRT